MAKPHEILLKKAKEAEKLIPQYVKSKEFETVAIDSLTAFIARVKRGLMPNLSAIAGFKDSYIKIRNRYKSNLGDKGTVKKSNATATGQMLNDLEVKMKPSGFEIVFSDSFRTKELNDASPRLLNSEIAKYYAEKRPIFDWSNPEIERIKRKIRTDLLKLLSLSK